MSIAPHTDIGENSPGASGSNETELNAGPNCYSNHPFVCGVNLWRDRGWLGTIPLPPKAKNPPPTGWTGRNADFPDDEQVDAWRADPDFECGNLGLHLGWPVTVNGTDCEVIGIDVDDYESGRKTKLGGSQLKRLETELGELPATWITSARADGVSGIRYLLAPGGLAFRGQADADIEVIQKAHRYAVVWPSVHPDGGTYRLYPPGVAPDGHGFTGEIPRVETLPLLPAKWVDYLTQGRMRDSARPIDTDIDLDGLADWAEAQFRDPYTLCSEMARQLDARKRLISTEASSHDKVRDAHWNFLRLAAEGHTGWLTAINEATEFWIQDVIARDKRAADELRREIFRSLTGAIRKIKAENGSQYYGKSPCGCGATPANGSGPIRDASVLEFPDAGGRPTSMTAGEFWESRQVLADLYQFAKSRRVSPWAMLGNVLLKAAAVIPPENVLPPIIGGHASLNLLAAFVGESGDGKGSATEATNDWLVTDPDVFCATVGSGEGLAKTYAYKQKSNSAGYQQIPLRWSVLFDVREVDNLAAVGTRSGSTLLPQLRSAYSGETLGFSYADPTKAIRICAHRYRFCLAVGVQPNKAGPLLFDSDGGTPQRFVWLPVLDPDMPDERPEPSHAFRLPNWSAVSRPKRVGKSRKVVAAVSDPLALLDTPSLPADRVEIAVPHTVVNWIDNQRVARHRGTEKNPLDGHAIQTRLKVAAVLMWIDGRTDKISDEDWNLAGAVMAVSDHTRQSVVKQLGAKRDSEQESLGRRDGVRADVAEQVKIDRAVSRVAENIARKLEQAGKSLARSDVLSKIAYRDRDYFDDAEAHLIETGRIEKSLANSVGGSDGHMLTLTGQASK